jgi:tripeptidyl-peptidase-1
MTTADAYNLHSTKTAQAPWELSKVQRKVNLQETIDMSIALKRKNVDLLEKILLEVSDPTSPKYGEHLNDAQMRELISPGTDAVEAVKAWLARHGITNVEVAKHEDGLKFKATRAQISSLLNVQWATYDNTASKQTAVRALDTTQIPDHLSGVIEMVAGHRGWPIPVKAKAESNKRAAAETVAAPFGMSVTPDLIYKQYNATGAAPATPSGKTNLQSFAQFQGQFVEQSDLSQFCSKYLPNNQGSCEIAKYAGNKNGNNAGVESSLDSEYIIATSKGATTWVYTYNGDDFCSDLISWAQDVFAGASDAHPNVVSISYGSQHLPMYCESSGASRLNADTMKMGAMGISVMLASGDEGSGQFSRQGWNFNYLSPSYPAELPYVTSVGSTTFESGNSGTERAASFSGGGFSWNFDAPSYQKAAIQNFLSTSSKLPKGKYNATGRACPDVSFLGEQFNVITSGQNEMVAGTSCSAPSFSGFVTLLNNVRLENGKTLGFLNPLMYQNPQGFTDITSGTNDMNHDSYGWYAQEGWDPVTGLGTPNFGKLVDIVRGINQAENQRKH